MPTQQITTQVTSQRAKQLVATVVSAFQDIRDAQEAVEDAQTGALYARYEWGRDVYSALQQAEQGDEMAEEIGRRLDYSAAWVRHHARFADVVTEAFPGFDPPVAGYVADCLDTDRSLAWRSAVRWMSSDNGVTEDEETTDLHQKKKKVERLVDRTEEVANEFAEAVMGRYDDLQPSERRDMEGVITRVKQTIDDTRSQIVEDLPEPKERRVVFPPYRKWAITQHACVCTGVEGEGIQPHHFRHGEWQQTGGSTKPPDFDVLPLYYELHDELEDMDYNAFWEKYDTDPVVELHRLKNEYLEKVTREIRSKS